VPLAAPGQCLCGHGPKIVLVLAAFVGIVVVAFAIFGAARQHLRFDAPYPYVAASTDTAIIARGRYVVPNADRSGPLGEVGGRDAAALTPSERDHRGGGRPSGVV